jgi:hypothetical protein
VNPHFRDAFANRLAIAEVAKLSPPNPDLNPPLGLLVTQAVKPGVENVRGQDGLLAPTLYKSGYKSQGSL